MHLLSHAHIIILYAHNQVDIEKPDMDKFLLFSNANFTEFTLHPGQMLYIPPRCWHYVRSLDISFSVSFWWS